MTPIEELVAQKRWAPRPVAVLIAIGWVVLIAAIAIESRSAAVDTRELLGALPLVLLLAYGSLAFALNRTEVRILADRVEVRNRPIPVGASETTVQLDEIELCYSRRSFVPLKTGSTRVCAAGIRLRNGKWLDVIPSFDTLDEAQAAAERIAAQISAYAGHPIRAENIGDYAPPVDWKQRRGLLIWSGAFIAALLWILIVDSF